MKSHISTPLHFVMIAETIVDSAQILTDNMEIIAEVQGKTNEETREIAAGICDAVNHREEMLAALEHSASSFHHPACKCRGERSANPECYCTCHVYKAQAVLTKLKKEA